MLPTITDIERKRVARRIPIKQLAEASGLKESTLWGYLRGARKIPLDTARDVCAALESLDASCAVRPGAVVNRAAGRA